MEFLLCYFKELSSFVLVVFLIFMFFAASILWACFAIMLVEKIDFLITYLTNYVRARIDYSKDCNKCKKYIAELEEELRLYNFEETRIMIKCFFNKPYTTTYSWENKLRITWIKMGYEKGIQSAIRHAKKG